jgi:hypothetical protein
MSITPAAPAPESPRRLPAQLPFDDFQDEVDENDDDDGNRLDQFVPRQLPHAPAFSDTDYQGGEGGGWACGRGGAGSPFSDGPRDRARCAPAPQQKRVTTWERGHWGGGAGGGAEGGAGRKARGGEGEGRAGSGGGGRDGGGDGGGGGSFSLPLARATVTCQEQGRERCPPPSEVAHTGEASFRVNCYRKCSL